MSNNTKAEIWGYPDSLRVSTPQQKAALDDTISQWVIEQIEGDGGLNAFEMYEWAIPQCSERSAAALWVIRVLGNSTSPETQAVFDAIAERRAEKAKKAKL